MANYLERVVLSGARATSPAFPPAGAPVMLPAFTLPIPAAAERTPAEPPGDAGPVVAEPARQESPRPIPRIRALEPTAAVDAPEPRAHVPVRVEQVTTEERPAEMVESAVPVEESRTVVSSPEVSAPVEIPMMAIPPLPAAMESQSPVPKPEAGSIQVKPATEDTPIPKVESTPVAAPLPLKAPARPAAPLFFRFQQPPVHIDAPRAMRPRRTHADTPQEPAPPEPISLPSPLAPAPRRDQPVAATTRDAPVSVQKPIETPHLAAFPKAPAVLSPMPAPVAPRQKRIHIGAVEVHVHNETQPAPPVAMPRPSPSNRTDPFEQRGLNRFALRP